MLNLLLTITSPTQSPQESPSAIPTTTPLSTGRTPATHQQIPVPLLSSTHEPTTPSSTPNTHITSPTTTAHGNALTTNTHHMVTRAKARISKPHARMNCHATTISPIPRSHLHALRDPNWHKAMVDEYNALISNGTWALVPRPSNVNIVRSMWLFRHKFNADGSRADDIILTASSTALLQRIITLLHKKILERAHMQHCNPCKTPVDTESKLGSDGDPVSDPTLYRSLQLYVSSTSQLTAYTDADWAGCPVTRRASAERGHQLLKHLEIDIHFVRVNMLLPVRFVCFMSSSRFQYADIFTKGLPTALFLEFRSSLNVRRSPAHTEGVIKPCKI
ncbi:ribonuclease H-like domain-containing protein [Tanacetum coccineum]